MHLNTLQKYLNTVIKYKLKNVFKYINTVNVFKYNVFKYCPALNFTNIMTPNSSKIKKYFYCIIYLEYQLLKLIKIS